MFGRLAFAVALLVQASSLSLRLSAGSPKDQSDVHKAFESRYKRLSKEVNHIESVLRIRAKSEEESEVQAEALAPDASSDKDREALSPVYTAAIWELALQLKELNDEMGHWQSKYGGKTSVDSELKDKVHKLRVEVGQSKKKAENLRAELYHFLPYRYGALLATALTFILAGGIAAGIRFAVSRSGYLSPIVLGAIGVIIFIVCLTINLQERSRVLHKLKPDATS